GRAEGPLPPEAGRGPGRWLDLQVMLLCGGRERTVEDYAGLFEKAGLRLARTLPTGHPAMTGVEAVAAGSPRARSIEQARRGSFGRPAPRHLCPGRPTRGRRMVVPGCSGVGETVS